MRAVLLSIRVALCAALALFGVLKLGSGYDPRYLAPAWAYWSIAVGELALAALLWTTWQRPCARALAWACALGIVWAYAAGSHRPCGCAGAHWHMTLRDRIVVLACMGAGATLLGWWRHRADPGLRAAPAANATPT